MRAVNLIPADARRGGTGSRALPQSPAYAVIGLLAAALVLTTIYVLTVNTISSRQAKLANLQVQVAQERAEVARLNDYAAFASLAQARDETVREIAAARFDWHGVLSDLSKVVPVDTALQSLNGSVAPGATVTGANGAATSTGSGPASTLRGDLMVPALELTGCTKNQDDVARLMSRLRTMNGVTRVTLGDSQKSQAGQAGASVGGAGGAAGCGANTPTFDVVVFFEALPSAGPTGVTSASSQPVSNITTAGATK